MPPSFLCQFDLAQSCLYMFVVLHGASFNHKDKPHCWNVRLDIYFTVMTNIQSFCYNPNKSSQPSCLKFSQVCPHCTRGKYQYSDDQNTYFPKLAILNLHNFTYSSMTSGTTLLNKYRMPPITIVQVSSVAQSTTL